MAAEHAPTILITGAGTGIGKEFARQYAAAGWHVIATYRGQTAPRSLIELGRGYPLLQPERMDVTDLDQIDQLARKLADRSLDVVINNAGITNDGDGNSLRQNFGSLDFSLMEKIFATNVKGPLAVSQAFASHLERGRRKVLVSISSAHGSLTAAPPTLEELQGLFYSASKAALNRQMQIVSSVLQSRGITVLLFNPGAVWTERYEEYIEQHGDAWPKEMFISTNESVAGMIAAIDRAAPAGGAVFFNHDGAVQPW